MGRRSLTGVYPGMGHPGALEVAMLTWIAVRLTRNSWRGIIGQVVEVPMEQGTEVASGHLPLPHTGAEGGECIGQQETAAQAEVAPHQGTGALRLQSVHAPRGAADPPVSGQAALPR